MISDNVIVGNDERRDDLHTMTEYLDLSYPSLDDWLSIANG